MVPQNLKVKIAAVLGCGALAIAGVLIRHHEGIRYVPYADPGNGTLTVCYGHTGPDIIPKKTYTQEECEELLEKDMAIAQAAVHRRVKVPMNKMQEAALIDFTYNVGEGNLMRSVLLQKMNAGLYDEACTWYRSWVRAGGRKLPGLVNRRDADEWVCKGAK